MFVLMLSEWVRERKPRTMRKELNACLDSVLNKTWSRLVGFSNHSSRIIFFCLTFWSANYYYYYINPQKRTFFVLICWTRRVIKSQSVDNKLSSHFSSSEEKSSIFAYTKKKTTVELSSEKINFAKKKCENYC